ncbi:hypothetical protein [Streptomyces sp. NP-1717]|uniref:hypothetical protein n=1 Tax=Streptomyces sp. NP-1717 TaxID=2704470 RepID=UPI001F5DCF59|nr:hypothetical protein [Streptomyces sp. NP-1717]MCI3224121.1 hypothetical protein [Streptomyces sp. NP-1717]
MSDSAVTEFTSVQTQYEAQVAADLENNTAERQRLRGEIESLQAKLETLEHDHTLLLGLQRVFAGGSASASARGAKVPGARAPKRPAKSSAGSAKTSKARTRTKSSAKRAAANTGAAEKQPSLAQLVSTMLAAHGEPRSAAEISAELVANHPARNSNINVVRNALELLVAKSEAHRAKQKKSVFYTHAGRDGDAAPAPSADATPAAG